jgi:excisionase family DNA binding protein
MPGQSYRVSEAANLLGVSVPTLKSLVRDKKLRAFRTPGGQLRVLADSLEQVQQGPALRPAREASPVLQNRRERVEELALEAQELRAGHEIRKLRQEDAAEARQKREERQERAREAEQEAQRLELEQQQLEIQRHERAEHARAQAALRDFRQGWFAHADKLLAAFTYAWLTLPQRKEITEALEAEIAKHSPDDERRMERIVQNSLASFVAPLEAQREIARRCGHALDRVLLKISVSATPSERVRAEALAREALRQVPFDADADELLTKAQDAIAPVSRAIEDREVREKRQASKQGFIRSAFVTVSFYKSELRDQDEISQHEYSDRVLWDGINEDVRHELSQELTGDESPQEVEGLIRSIVDEAFELEAPKEDQG